MAITTAAAAKGCARMVQIAHEDADARAIEERKLVEDFDALCYQYRHVIELLESCKAEVGQRGGG